MNDLSFALNQPESSRFIRTSWMLSADGPINFADNASIRSMTVTEATGIAEMLMKRNTFARTSRGKHFYVERAEQLGGRTIIELYLPGQPDDILAAAESHATLLERLIVLASTFKMNRVELHRKLGVSTQPTSEHNLVIGPKCYCLRSTKQRRGEAGGLRVDGATLRRFSALGFQDILTFSNRPADVCRRVLASLNWLFESRIEPRVEAAVVKTSIAFETLLVFSETEALARSLSERTAFLLSDKATTRELLSNFVKRFYDVRSGVVHGGAKKQRRLSPELLECADRCVLALALKVAVNVDQWNDSRALRAWCEARRWGYDSTPLTQQLPASILRQICESAETITGEA